MMRRLTPLRWWTLALPVVLSAAPCFAQSGGLFGSRGPQSSTSSGGVRSSQGNYTGFNSSTSNGFGSTPGFGANGFGQSGSGSGQGLGSMNFGQTGTGATGQAGGMSRTSALNGGLNGAGRTSNLGQTGVGGPGGNQNALGGLGQRNGLNGLGGRGNQRNGNRNGLNNLGNEAAEQQMPVRIRPQVNFQFAARPATSVNGSIEARFQHVSQRSLAFREIQFELGDAGQVTLRGTVPTEDSRRLAAALVRLEPGVRGVTNELTVEAPAAVGQ